MENGEKTTDIDDEGIFIMCDCYGHALHVARFEKEEEIYLSVFERGLYGGKLSWRERVRWMWQILRRGSPFTDEFILTRDKQKKLAEFLVGK